MIQGFYFAIDGLSGSGKSTAAREILKHIQQKDPDCTVLMTREPDNSVYGREIRALRAMHKEKGIDTKLHASTYSKMYAECGLRNYKDVVEPNIDRGIHVIKDRITSITQLAYQRREGVPLEDLLPYWKHAPDMQPDLVAIIDVSAEVAFNHIKNSGRKMSSLENVPIMTELRKYFQEIPKLLNSTKVQIVNGNQSMSGMVEDLKKVVDQYWSKKYK